MQRERDLCKDSFKEFDLLRTTNSQQSDIGFASQATTSIELNKFYTCTDLNGINWENSSKSNRLMTGMFSSQYISKSRNWMVSKIPGDGNETAYLLVINISLDDQIIYCFHNDKMIKRYYRERKL